MRRKLPVIVGRMAKDHYQENFRFNRLFLWRSLNPMMTLSDSIIIEQSTEMGRRFSWMSLKQTIQDPTGRYTIIDSYIQ
jgi:hypothetical protein